MKNVTLNNNQQIPILGLGTFKLAGKETIEKAVTYSIEVGYRHIDTAAIYMNETEIGNAIKTSGVNREGIFITSKVWNSNQGYYKTLSAFDESINKLQTNYLDLYLIHWAVKNKFPETWGAFEELYTKGVVKSIGVSNFQIHHLNEILKNFKIKPVVNQIELHPFFIQEELRNFCKENNIQIESWSPIVRGRILNESIVLKLSEKYKKTPAQIIIRWHIENNLVVIPKSATPERIKENFDVFDFELSAADVSLISSMNKNMRIGPDPDNFDF